MTRLFKFISNFERDIEGLKNDYIYLAPLEKLNDPFEGIFHLKTDVTEGDLISFHKNVLSREPLKNITPEQEVQERYLTEKARDVGSYKNVMLENFVLPELNSSLEKIKSDFVVYCLSRSKDDNDPFPSPLNNMSLWGHYANGLRGFCIEYDEDVLLNSLVKSHPKSSISKGRIHYKTDNQLPSVSVKAALKDAKSNSFETHKSLLKAIMTKNAEPWRVENETRIIAKDKEGKYSISPESVNSIYIGSKMPESEKILLLQAIKKKKSDIRVYLVSQSSLMPTYGFSFKEIQIK